ncbi:unnamed protein product, partial [Closterium sp. Yama58-4]
NFSDNNFTGSIPDSISTRCHISQQQPTDRHHPLCHLQHDESEIHLHGQQPPEWQSAKCHQLTGEARAD